MEDGDKFSPLEIELMIKILNMSSIKNLTMTTISQITGLSKTSPTLYHVVNKLLEKNLISHTEEIGNARILKVHKKKLRDFIDELPLTNFWYDYFSGYHYISW